MVVVPTLSIAPEIWPLRLALGSFGGKDSYAVIPGIRQVRKVACVARWASCPTKNRVSSTSVWILICGDTPEGFSSSYSLDCI